MKVLIGSTGFVGAPSPNRWIRCGRAPAHLETVRGISADLVVCAGMPAAKWAINQDPAGDRENMLRLMDVLGSMAPSGSCLISTIDVYAQPNGVDESVPADLDHPQAYGRHRAVFEAFVRETFPEAVILRLPGLFGRRLRKNLIFDLLQGAQRPVHEGQRGQHVPVLRRGTDLAGRAGRIRLPVSHWSTSQPNRSPPGDVAHLFGVHLPARRGRRHL